MLADALTAAAQQDATPQIVGVPVKAAGFRAYVRRLPTADARAALGPAVRAVASVDGRRAALIAACSCWGGGDLVPADSAEYAALLGQANRNEIAKLYKAAAHLNGYAELELLAGAQG